MTTCCGIDHRSSTYTPQQRADLDLVLAFNRRMADSIDGGLDVSPVEKLLDPDPLRYMWVDEGSGRISHFLDLAEGALAGAVHLDGHLRVSGTTVHDSDSAARPTVAVGPDGQVLHAWIEWRSGAGDQVLATLLPAGTTAEPPVAAVEQAPVALSGASADCFRPTALFDAAGRAWVLWARSDGRDVTVWARRREGGAWLGEEQVGGAAHPSFNQECVAHADGGVEVVWQAPVGARFAVVSRRWADGAWGETIEISPARESGNVWDPSVAARPDGTSVYAWCEYTSGSYRVVERHRRADGALSAPRPLTGGSDYAMHPSLAITPGGDVWCAFDVISVAGHGGSGPTRLRAHADLGPVTRHPGVRASGAAVPSELLPEVSAAVRVLRIDDDGLHEAPGAIAPHLDVVPSGLPRLVADDDGSLVLAYRVHRRLPLMTYYWEVATQTCGPDGWGAPTTYSGSDGTLEEPALTAMPGGAVLAWQSDGRLELSLSWTEGFGGWECPVLLEHHGEVIWHGMHRAGTIRSARVPGGGTAHRGAPLPGSVDGVATSDERVEARTWVGAGAERYSTTVGGTEHQLYWGDLHRHSLISRCTSGDEPSLEDFYRYSWDVCEYDFWAVTDHAENSTDYQWRSIKKIADLFRVDGRFVPFYGFEWTGLMGHQNVIYGDVGRDAPIFSAYAAESDDPRQLWDQLAKYPQHPAITIPHHPGSAMVPYDWDYGDERFLRVVEVFQACRGSYEQDGCFRQYSDGTLPGTFVLDGLRTGQRFGMIASSDHGHGASYVGAFATSLDRGAVFDALRSRRVFAATQRDIVLDVRVGEAFMGQETVADGPVELVAVVKGYTDLARVDVLRDGVVVHSELPVLDLPPGWLTVHLRVEWGQAEGSTDWSGDLGIDGGRVVQTPFWSTDVVTADSHRVAWSDVTKSFGAPYGSERGGVEMTLVGPPEAVVDVAVVHGGLSTTLGALAGRVVDVPLSGPGRMTLQPGAGGLSSMGTRESTVRWGDDDPAGAFYYVRAFLVDGEMAWSSPIWVDAPPR